MKQTYTHQDEAGMLFRFEGSRPIAKIYDDIMNEIINKPKIMNKQIWKFILLPGHRNFAKVEMPEGAEILTVQVQNANICLWALVTPENSLKSRNIEVFGTGHDIPFDGISIYRRYIGSVQLESGLLVFHVFERLDPIV